MERVADTTGAAGAVNFGKPKCEDGPTLCDRRTCVLTEYFMHFLFDFSADRFFHRCEWLWIAETVHEKLEVLWNEVDIPVVSI